MKHALEALTEQLNDSRAQREYSFAEVQKHQGNIEFDAANPHLNPDPRSKRLLAQAKRDLENAESEIADYVAALQVLVKATEPVVEVKKFFRPADVDIDYNRETDTVEVRLHDDLKPEGETLVAVVRMRTVKAFDFGIQLLNNIRPALDD